VKTDPFVQSLWDEVASVDFSAMTFVQRIVAGDVPRERLRRWAPQFCAAVDTFKRFIAQVYANCEPADARYLLAQNLFEEHGEMDESKDHTRLAADFMRAIGAGDDDIEHGAPMPELVEWSERCLRVCRDEPFVAGLAGVTFAIEGGSPAIMTMLGTAFLERYGVPRDALEYFFMHVDADEEHTARGLELVERYADTPELRERCRAAVKEFMEATLVLARGFERITNA
jgi:pyrroloquinoline-quinone synthase